MKVTRQAMRHIETVSDMVAAYRESLGNFGLGQAEIEEIERDTVRIYHNMLQSKIKELDE